jgi:glutamyl-tRNA synthetase
VVVVNDAVYGQVEINSSAIEDQVLLKTDGFPTYHLACVVDDHCMDVSHVLRGEEWLLSTPKHLLLYTALGWSPPIFGHLPLLLSSSGEKLSKRQHGASLQSYRERGFLGEAVAEFLSELGWSQRDDSRTGTQSLEELALGFSLEGLNRNAVSVDEEKLMWINKKHFRRRLQGPSSCNDLARQLAESVQTTLRLPVDSNTLRPEYLNQVLQLLGERTSLIPMIPVVAAYFWRAPDFTRETIPSVDNAAEVLEAIRQRLSKTQSFSQSSLTSELKAVSSALDIPHKVTMTTCRAAVIGQQASPGVAAVCEVLGRDVVLDRLKQSIAAIR